MPPARVLLFCWLLWPAALLQAQPLQQVPALSARVTDLVGALDAAQTARLETELATLERETGSQVAVLIVDSTAPEDIAAYAIRVVDAWQLGRAQFDDGVLFLVALGDRRMRIEVGYGLEGAIPDARARQIIDTIIAPHFRAGDIGGGIAAGVGAIATLVRGENLPLPDPGSDAEGETLISLIPFVILAGLVIGPILKRLFGTLPGSLATGAALGLIVWIMIAMVSVALFAGIVGFVLALAGGSGGSWSNRGGFGGGFRGGFGGGLGGGSRGGFGGGFSGGGGGFGGGGASGGW